MPYVPKIKYLAKMLFRIRDPQAAEALWYEGTWLHDNGDDEGARLAFAHSRLLDPDFAGAHYNYAALTEKLTGESPETLNAWQEYLKAAKTDARQGRDTVKRVQDHVEELKEKLGKKLENGK